MAEFRRFRILAWVNKYVFVCLSRFMCAHTPFHKPSHKKVSEVFFGRPLSTFYGVVCMWRRGALHRSPVMCFSLETVWETLGNKACASQGALTAIIFSQKKKEHFPCLPDSHVPVEKHEDLSYVEQGRRKKSRLCCLYQPECWASHRAWFQGVGHFCLFSILLFIFSCVWVDEYSEGKPHMPPHIQFRWKGVSRDSFLKCRI